MYLWKVLIIVLIVAIILIILGAIGFHFVIGEDWIDSFYLASLTMSSLSLETKPRSQGEKIFVALYTLVSIGFYLILIAAIIAAFLEPCISQANQLDQQYNSPPVY